MVLVRIDDKEFFPLLADGYIRLKSNNQEEILTSKSEHELLALKSEFGGEWFPCDYSQLQALLHEEDKELLITRARVQSGQLVQELKHLGQASSIVKV
jgi:hypothetical protein